MLEIRNIDRGLLDDISARLYAYENPKRRAISSRYPVLVPLILLVRRTLRNLQNKLNFKISNVKNSTYYKNVIKRHQSPLRRKLGTSDPILNERKIVNLNTAIDKLDGIVIKPGHIFSLWDILGNPTAKRGYVEGMLLSNGKVVEGVGGGLCQLSNLLYWAFLHAETKIIERHHHSIDVFPDSGRTLPFGSGATIMYNFVDLQVQNLMNTPMQIKLWLTENQLTCQLLSTAQAGYKYHIFEGEHYFIKRGEKYFRYNKIYREKLSDGKVVGVEVVTTNFAPVMYKVDDVYIEKHNFSVIDFTDV